MALSAHTRRRLHDALDAHNSRQFRAVDFVIEAMDEMDDIGLPWETHRIRYLYEHFTLQFAIEPGNAEISISVNPGSILTVDTAKVQGVDGLLHAMDRWLYRVDDELKAAPLARELAQQREQIEEIMARLANVEDTMFTREEAERAEDMVDEMKQRLTDLAAQTAADKAELKEEIEKLSRTLETMRGDIGTTTKKNWYRRILSRFIGIATNPAVQKAMIQLAEHGAEKITDKILPP